MERPWSRVAHHGLALGQLVAISYLTLLASLLFWSHAPALIGWQPRVVLTGSMSPAVRPGDVAVIGPAVPGPGTLPIGRVVLVSDPRTPSGSYLHRVQRYDDHGLLITKGDANAGADSTPVEPAQVRGQLRLVVPMVGRPVVWLARHDYRSVAGASALTWLALLVAVSPQSRPRRSAHRRSNPVRSISSCRITSVRARGRGGALPEQVLIDPSDGRTRP